MEISLPVHLGPASVRYLVLADADAYMRIERDPEVKRFVGGPIKKEDHQVLSWFASPSQDANLMAIADKDSDSYIGRCGLTSDGLGDLEMSCVLSTAHQKKGIGRSVFAFLEQTAVQAGRRPVGIIDPQNDASRGLFESLGFVSEGPISFTGSYQNGHLRYVRKSDVPTA